MEAGVLCWGECCDCRGGGGRVCARDIYISRAHAREREERPPGRGTVCHASTGRESMAAFLPLKPGALLRNSTIQAGNAYTSIPAYTGFFAPMIVLWANEMHQNKHVGVSSCSS